MDVASALSVQRVRKAVMPLGLHLHAKQKQAFRLGQVVGMLQMTTAELDEHLAQAAQDNPLLIVRRRPIGHWGATDVLETTAITDTNSLYEHVHGELAGLIAQGGKMRALICALIEELEPSGWLACSTSEIAKLLGLKDEIVEVGLRVVQKRVTPAGLFARDLKECLRLQLEDRGALTDDMDRVVAHLHMLETANPVGLAQAAGLEPSVVDACLAVIRRLNPKPGGDFVTDPTLMREPDVIVAPSHNGWGIEFRSSTRTDLEIAKLPRGRLSPETREALANARTLKRALEMRRSALEQVVTKLVEHQGQFFHRGPEALRPMTMSEIARETGFHLSTVSRVMAGLLIEGPNGVVDARTLVAGTASVAVGQSTPRVQARMRALLSAEHPQNPLTDQRLTELLHQEGILVSRRVVSKYRRNLGLSTAACRRLKA